MFSRSIRAVSWVHASQAGNSHAKRRKASSRHFQRGKASRFPTLKACPSLHAQADDEMTSRGYGKRLAFEAVPFVHALEHELLDDVEPPPPDARERGDELVERAVRPRGRGALPWAHPA